LGKLRSSIGFAEKRGQSQPWQHKTHDKFAYGVCPPEKQLEPNQPLNIIRRRRRRSFELGQLKGKGSLSYH